jgi:hypothetical protein
MTEYSRSRALPTALDSLIIDVLTDDVSDN